MLTRAYASVLNIIELPFSWPEAKTPRRLHWLYPAVLRPGARTGLIIVTLTLLIVSAANLRLALFLLFFLLYFGGYPAVQFASRHFFHLEFITWWAGGFLVDRLLVAMRTRSDAWRPLSARRAAAFAAITVAAIGGPLLAARTIQAAEARRLFDGYAQAPRQTMALPPIADGSLHRIGDARGNPPGHFDAADAAFFEVDLDRARCGEHPSVTFRYDPSHPGDFSRTFTPMAERAPGLTRIYAPVFDHFLGLEFTGLAPGCVSGVYKIGGLERFPLLVFAMLEPQWQHGQLHQQVRSLRPIYHGG
jgi:hypothetical protein